MLFTDTDSLTYKIRSENVYEEFLKRKHLFDFSIFSKDSKFFEEANKKVFVKSKDVSRGNIIDEFVGLKSKKYSIKYIDGKESNTAKGVYISTEFNEFKDTLLKKKILRNKMRGIQAKNHKLGTYEIDKVSLSCFDDKRSISKNEIHTRDYFHKRLFKKMKKGLRKKKRFSQIKKIENVFRKRRDSHG